MKRHTAKPNYILDMFREKAPLDWDEVGKVTVWQESTFKWPVRCNGDKWAWSWNDTLGTIGLWAFTLPPETVEYVKADDYKAPKTKGESEAGRSIYQPAGIETKINDNLWRFALEPLKDFPEEMFYLFQLVDDVARTDAWSEGKPDVFGFAPYSNYLPLSEEAIEMNKATRSEVIEALGKILFEAIRERRGDALALIGQAVDAAEGVPLSKMEMGNLPVRFAGNDLRGVVWRCYNILHNYMLNPPLCSPGHVASLPVKRTLKAYVRQEWEAMAGKEVTVQTEFSRILKELGLSGLPDGSSAPGGAVF